MNAILEERSSTTQLNERLARLVDDRPKEGLFRVHGSAFTSEEIFELEMKHIFESTWMFLGHESEIANPHDFISTSIGRQAVLLTRDADGEIHALHNSCTHRGALLTSSQQGNRRIHSCPYHAWAFSSSGKLVAVHGKEAGAYLPAFDNHNHDLKPIARCGNYRGFIFGSLNPDVPSLDEHLADSKAFIDLVVDQGADGLELIPGRVTFTYNANWKWQIENGTDSYHFRPTHSTYLDVLDRQRKVAEETGKAVSQSNVSAYVGLTRERTKLQRGVFDLGNGHAVMFGPTPTPEARPLFVARDDLVKRVGEVRAKWMLYTRNLNIYPNLQLWDNIASLLALIRPISANQTEMITYCIGPKGEDPEARRRRIRHCEQFLNLGIANPDDMACYEACQQGLVDQPDAWVDYARGMAVLQHGASPEAAELGVNPQSWVYSDFDMGDETGHQHAFREWLRLLSTQPKQGN
ncbi:aromatic ring-hydroxylating oxygenase subunit alpha [Pusillimonas noertemannii]|uniref:Benzoate 1,2-dioxygenase alpha subunit n=1 Tax=Pusillimonas noertemannii TaxID=305977 RepID=A0A2U1CL10_9BURK|nr:Rieske 2Fe-2S domain-containing protein [Pusillimonas noertemannii]NYT69204.1 Rieske 2Fe-2S domain-containing protein [Pusillimonas noertemannii]PVY61673.1 benzoate 1,2-dioxygenase alpha subunit [Pusillimonas noertemannii]TFL09614.1 ribosomal subunit interface protein [Pusillimonas noertemannii]